MTEFGTKKRKKQPLWRKKGLPKKKRAHQGRIEKTALKKKGATEKKKLKGDALFFGLKKGRPWIDYAY